ncbi:MAG: aminopeptidase N [Tepidiforma sp.]|nr:aminopeptidase N [Tepidiforma sp.]GIW17491.1 MAG: aminopeptidase N [Tepidiforma sp.]
MANDPAPNSPDETPRDVLTQAEAEARAARVSACDYVLDLDLTAGAPGYRGDATLRFDLAGEGDLFLDFRGRHIERLDVNGRVIESLRWNGYRLWLPAEALAASNTVRIVYENDYDHEGDGFHQFIDPEDGEEYLYTNFEPYESHRLFPQFDQPDIKGTYRLTVTAPAGWELIHNTAPASVEAAPGGRRRWAFQPTKRFSTYLFALVAGPYHVVRDRHGDTDLGLFCRKSLARYLDADEIFEVSKQGLDFYADFFGFAYPFGKYDQVFVPEFNSGAMENVACVTHNEYMVFRDPPTTNQRRSRAEVVLHEMAHMWFGNLVTMRWWNDLWLNESFATYMSYLCMDQATKFDSGWLDFASSIKNWAYRQDQLVTTHPIAGTVEDTDQTFLNFDGITYGKGASVLKQLVAAVGLEGFREGMREYFRRYAYGNATLADFLAAVEHGSGTPLAEWARLWLETPSLNTIAARWTVEGDRVASLALEQTAPADYPYLRPHRLDVGLAREEEAGLRVTVLPASISGPRAELPEAVGLPRPDFVFPNYGDHGYCKVALDPVSLEYVLAHIDRVDDTLLRLQLWASLWNMVRDQQLSSLRYLALVREKAPREHHPELLEAVTSNALLALGRYVPDEAIEPEARQFFEAALAALRGAPQGDLQKLWARTLIGAAATAGDVETLCRLADGEVAVPGLLIDQEMRWAIAAKAVAYGLPGAAERLAAEAARDPSDRGVRARLRAETSAPDPAVKEAAWAKFLGEGYGSLYLTAAAMSGFNWRHQRALLEPYVDRFFDAVPTVFAERDKEFATDFFRNLAPAYRVEKPVIERARQLLERAGDQVLLRRTVLEFIDDMERALRCRDAARAGLGQAG